MIKYTKVNGNGNNFLVLNNWDNEYDDVQLRTMALGHCNVKTSIGADGILVVEKSDIADIKMRIINRNGLEGEMCGNGARCAARYAYNKNMAPEKMTMETMAGIVKAQVFKDTVMLDLGAVNTKDAILHGTAEYKGKTIIYHYLYVGVPHAVVYLHQNEIASIAEMKDIGEYLDGNREIFSEGANVNFVKLLDSESIDVTTYERGVDDFTDSCGTGSCASAVITALKFGIQSPVTVQNPGGINMVSFKFGQNNEECLVELEGKAVCSAEIEMID
ncbi:MAG TPA: diaminopimelate epimerase [Clostridiales bacterium]|nr:diaminopimelate epimerase [Clostridiales bacterium]